MKGKCIGYKLVEDVEMQKILWNIYLSELGPSIVSETAFPQQCFDTFEMFQKVLMDQEFHKFILFSENNQIIGLGIASNNLHKVKNLANIRFNPEIYELMFPDFYKRNAVYYFPAMCILKAYQDEGYFTAFASTMITMVYDNNGVAAFDYSERKNPNMAGLLVYLCQKINLPRPVNATIVDQQSFAVVG